MDSNPRPSTAKQVPMTGRPPRLLSRQAPAAVDRPAAMILGRAALGAARAVPTAAPAFGISLLLGATNDGGAPGSPACSR